MNILVTNIGRRGYLIDFIKNNSNFIGKVYASDCDITASGLYGNCDEYFILTRPVDNPEKYIGQLIELCKRKNIKIVIPVIDPEIYILAKYKNKFHQEGIFLVVSDEEVLETCYNKIIMNTFLEKYHFAVTRTYRSIAEFKTAYEKKNIEFPVFIKPIYGSGSVDAFKINTMKELEVLFKKDMLIQEFLVGEEYGVDIFNNHNKEPVRIIIKRKLSMRSGETDKAISVYDEEIKAEAIKLAKLLGHFGPLDCDVIKTKDKAYIIDLNPRLGGGYPATHMTGIDFTELILKLYNNEPIYPDFNNYRCCQLTMKDISIKTVNLEGGLER